MGLGMAALGRPGYINLGHADDWNRNYDKDAMQARAHEVLDLAWESGIRYFDTARSYGLGEVFLGTWMIKRKLEHSDVLVSSKWGYTYVADWQVKAKYHEVKDHSLTVLKRQWKESNVILSGYLDLYQIHSATLDSGVLKNTKVLAYLANLKAEGTSIGLSSSGANQSEVLKQAMDVEVDGKMLFDMFQSTYNLLDRSTKPVLKEAYDRGLGIIIKEALANGRLTDKNQNPKFSSKFQVLEDLAQELETSIDGLALAAVLKEPWVDQVLSGAASKEHLLSNLKAVDIDWTDELEEKLAVLEEKPNDYWEIRKLLAWN